MRTVGAVVEGYRDDVFVACETGQVDNAVAQLPAASVDEQDDRTAVGRPFGSRRICVEVETIFALWPMLIEKPIKDILSRSQAYCNGQFPYLD